MKNSAAQEFEEKKEQLIEEIYIHTADEDYAASRWLFLNKLYRPFYWSAAQATEKYLKAILLLNGKSVKNDGHKLSNMLAKAKVIVGDLMPEKFTMPQQVKIFNDQDVQFIWGNDRVSEFVKHLENFGNPSNRYDYFGTKTDISVLYKFDQLVFHLRRLTENLKGIVPNSDPPIAWEVEIRSLPEAYFRPLPSYLIDKEKASESVYTSLRQNNYAFHTNDFLHENLTFLAATSVSNLRILYKHNFGYSTELRDWVKKNMFITDAEIARLSK